MNKDALVAEVANKAGVARSAAQKAVEAVIDTIKDQVSKGQKVALVGFGTFERRMRNARTARNPRTGESVRVPKTNVPAFKPGAAFKDSVGGKRGGGAKTGAKKASAKGATKKVAARRSARR